MGCGSSLSKIDASIQGAVKLPPGIPPEFIADVTKIMHIKVTNPDNLMAKNFDPVYFLTLNAEQKKQFLQCCRSGIANPDSAMGCYAMQPADYDRFKPFFKKVLAGYHKVSEDAKHVNDWSLSGVAGLPDDGILDLSKLGLPDLSMRVRVGRNLKAFPLPGAMTADDRKNMEELLCTAFAKLIEDPNYGGNYHSLTPGHKDFIDGAKYKELVDAHIMFKDMSEDSYLASCGIASDWPTGRGCYVSEDKGFIIWVGEEDHLRIMCMKKGHIINDVFDRLKSALDTVESLPGLEFAKSPDYGYVTSCPTNLGTGMRASLHIALPNLTADGTDKWAKKIAKPFGLSVRGLGGEHTPIGADGTVDISPSARFCIKEAEIVTALYKGIEKLKAKEDDLFGEDLAKIAKIKETHPENRMAKHFDISYFNSLSAADKIGFIQCCRSGIENADSGMGCYAMQPADYDKFKPFFGKVIADYHKVSEDSKHVNDWSLKGVEGLPENGILDISKLGLPALSMRVRVGRNLQAFPLPGAMSAEDRKKMEEVMTTAFQHLISKKEFGGRYHSLTPGHKDFIDQKKYQELVDAHIMFKDMSADSYLASCGIASDWPIGRGCYVSEDKGFIIWVGEEDHLRIMCMKKGTVINDVFDRLKSALDTVESLPGMKFAKSPDFGYVTSCPTNLGTGMRASLHIALPKLTADGTDTKAKAVAKPFGLSVRGLGGEHTPIGKDGTVDISPSARFCIKEAEIVTALYKGIENLKKAEDSA